MNDNDTKSTRLAHKSYLSSDELIVLLEENVEEYALIVMDPARRIINWSRGAEEIFGYKAEEVLGKDSAVIFTPEDRKRDMPDEEFQTAIKNGRAADERSHMRKDGSIFWASGSLTALYDAERRLRGTVKILRDVTERKHLEDALRSEKEAALCERNRAEQERAKAEASAREVAHLNDLLRRAMAEAHHRIKNSFQMLSALIEMQEGSQEDGAAPDNSKLSLHVRSLSAIHDLLTQEAKSGVEFSYLSARTLLEKLVQLMQNTVTGRSIRAEVDEIALPLNQATSVTPLLSEMVANAVKHGRGDILIRLSEEDGDVRLEVCDQGPGFPEGFDPRSSAHTGIELIEMLARHDLRGTMRYENLATGGARVTATFPISK